MPAGFGAPHSVQNLPLFTVPQEQVQPSAAASGFFEPHWVQKLPVFTAPQVQVQPGPAAFAGWAGC